MNVNCSMTRIKILERLTDDELNNKWNEINWKKVEKEVNKLQSRLAKAIQNNRYNDVIRLQYLLIHSFSGNAIAVKNITEIKTNKKLLLTPKEKMEILVYVSNNFKKLKLCKNSMIKISNKETKQDLKIFKIYEEVIIELYRLAFSSYNKKIKLVRFIESICDKDICEYISQIVLEKNKCKLAFKAKIEKEKYINKKIDNFLIENNIKKTIKNNKKNLKNINKTDMKINITTCIKCENEFIIISDNKEDIIKIKKFLINRLEKLKIKIIEEKESILNIEQGFEIFNFNYKIENKSLVITLSKEAIKKFINKISNIILGKGKSWRQEKLIDILNFEIKYWINYNQSTITKKICSKIDYVIFNLLYRWSKRRHPNKSHNWIVKKYWRKIGHSNWVFATEKNKLVKMEKFYKG